MGATRNTGYLENLIQYDASDNVAIATSVNPSYKVTLGGSMLGTSAVLTGTLTSGSDYLVNSITATKRGYTYQSPASNWGPQVSGLYFTPSNAIDAATTFTLSLWNGAGTTITPLTVAPTGAATFSSSVTATQLNATTTVAGYAAILTNTNGASDSNGLLVKAGSTSTEYNVRFANQTDTATFFTIKGNGYVGIGTTSPSSLLHMVGASATLIVADNTSYAAGVGGKISFHGNYRNIGDITEGGYIKASKTNATNGDYGFDMIFATSNYTAGVSERMRIDSVGRLVFNPASINDLNNSIFANSNGYFYHEGGTNGLILSNNSVQDCRIRIEDANTIQFETSSTQRMRIDASGNITFGVTSAYDTALLWRQDFTGAIHGRIYASGAPRIVVIAGESNGVQLTSGATSWTSNSDERLKNINGIIENAVDDINKLRAVKFSWKADKTNKENIGLIAQDIEAVFPQIVDKDENDILGVRYTEMIPVLVRAIQEQQKQIEELKSKLS